MEDVFKDHMRFKWMQLTNPGIRCFDLHPDTTCRYEVWYKFSNVMKKSVRFYLILYVMSFIFLKLRRIKTCKDFKKGILTLVINYCRSLMFMSGLVSSVKFYLCLGDSLTFKQPTFDIKVFVWGSLISSLSIFLEDKSRREQITYFVFVRAARSAYVYYKKRGLPCLPFEEKSAFILIFGMMAYLYFNNPKLLKNPDLMKKLWGTA